MSSKNYQQLKEEGGDAANPGDLYSVQNSSKANMVNKESYLSEESQQSSAMSLELRQKVNDQFQRKKMEFYKMYNKNPKEYREARANRAGKSNKISYQIQGEMADEDDGGADEFPEVDQYSDYYEEDDADDKNLSKEQKEQKKKEKAD